MKTCWLWHHWSEFIRIMKTDKYGHKSRIERRCRHCKVTEILLSQFDQRVINFIKILSSNAATPIFGWLKKPRKGYVRYSSGDPVDKYTREVIVSNLDLE